LSDVALAGAGFRGGAGLALPVEERGAEGVVFVTGEGREGLVRLVEGHEEEFGVAVRQVETAGLGVALAGQIRATEADEDLLPRVVAMKSDGFVESLFFMHERARFEDFAELAELLAARCVGEEEGQVLREIPFRVAVLGRQEPLDQHGGAALLHLVQRERRFEREAAIQGEAETRIDVEKEVIARDERGLLRPEPGGGEERGEGAVAAHVEILELVAGFGEELGEGGDGAEAFGQGAELGDHARPRGLELTGEVAEDDLAGDFVEVEVAVAGEFGEAGFELAAGRLAGAAEEGAEAEIEAEGLMLLADEVEYEAGGFAGVMAEAAAELLQKDGGAFGGAEE